MKAEKEGEGNVNVGVLRTSCRNICRLFLVAVFLRFVLLFAVEKVPFQVFVCVLMLVLSSLSVLSSLDQTGDHVRRGVVKRHSSAALRLCSFLDLVYRANRAGL